VEASNSCAKTLVFGSFFLLSSVKVFSPPLFAFFDLAFYYLFSFCRIGFFIILHFPFLFPYFFILVSLAHVVSSLAYPNLLGTKRLCCCCCCRLLHRLHSRKICLANYERGQAKCRNFINYTHEYLWSISYKVWGWVLTRSFWPGVPT
jgi:hypothetical protein